MRDGMLSVVWLVDRMEEGEPVSLRVVREAIRGAFSRYEIVLVTGDVAVLARRFREADPHVRIVSPEQSGDGAALTAGCAVVDGDYLLPVIDGTVPDWHALPVLAPFLERADVIAAYGVAQSDSAATNALTPTPAGFFFGVALREPLNPTKLYRAELLRGFSFISGGRALHLELAAKARAQGAIVTEVGIAERNSGSGAVMAVPIEQFGRLWLHLRNFRPRWTIRARSVGRTPSEYVCGGLVFATILWFGRGWFGRGQK